MLNDNSARVPASDLLRVESAIVDVRKAMQGDDVLAVRRSIEEIQRASHELAELLSRAQAGRGPVVQPPVNAQTMSRTGK